MKREGSVMQNGKISEIAYKRSVVKKITDKTEGILPGVDAAQIELEDVTVVMSSNCVLKWFEGCEDYYLQKAINNIYEKAAMPQTIQLAINIPNDFEEKLLGKIIRNFNEAVSRRNLGISQCKVYYSDVNSPVANITVIGTTSLELNRINMKPGMQIVMTGSIAIGGTSVISKIHYDKLSERYSGSFVTDCLSLNEYLDIQKAVQIAKGYAVCMHTVTDGGVFGAIWELASSVDLGVTVEIDKIPVWQETVEVAEMFDYNPYLLDGTGALLIVTENAEELVECLENEGICCGIIGQLTDTKDRIATTGDEVRYLEPPRGEILYSVI